MLEIRDKVIEDIEGEIAFICGLVYRYYTLKPMPEREIKHSAHKILAIKELAIVDRGTELPKNPYEGFVPAKDDKNWRHLTAYGEAQQDMLKAGWVKEIK